VLTHFVKQHPPHRTLLQPYNKQTSGLPCQTAPTPPHASTTIQQTDIRIDMSNSTHPTARFYNHTTSRHQDCRARNTVKSFLFVGHLILCILLVGQSTYLRSQRNVDFFFNSCVFNLKFHEFKCPWTCPSLSKYKISCPGNQMDLQLSTYFMNLNSLLTLSSFWPKLPVNGGIIFVLWCWQ